MVVVSIFCTRLNSGGAVWSTESALAQLGEVTKSLAIEKTSLNLNAAAQYDTVKITKVHLKPSADGCNPAQNAVSLLRWI
jgi:hypothetical protein